MQCRILLAGVTAAAVIAGFSIEARADFIIQAEDWGWYRSTGAHTASNVLYNAGQTSSNERRNFFVFDLSGVSGTIVGAQLELFNPSGGYLSSDSTETYSVYDVATPINELTVDQTNRTDIFNDLGGGSLYRSQTVSSSDNDDFVIVSLNSQAVTDISNAVGSDFALGGALTTLSGSHEQLIFAGTSAGTEVKRLRIITAVPEPSCLVLVGLGLLGGAVYRSTRRKGARIEPGFR